MKGIKGIGPGSCEGGKYYLTQRSQRTQREKPVRAWSVGTRKDLVREWSVREYVRRGPVTV